MSTTSDSDESDGLPPTRQFEAVPSFSKAKPPAPAAAKAKPPPSDSEDDSASDDDDDDDDDDSEPGGHAHADDPLEAGHEGDIVNWAEQVDDAAVEASGRRLAALYSTKVGEEGASGARVGAGPSRR